MPRLISACLLGIPCRYDGRAKGLSEEQIAPLREKHTLIPVCPELYGGLPTPREPAEIVNGRVLNRCGEDVTQAFEAGAAACVRIAEIAGADAAYLTPRSPSCGIREIYDGSFCGRLIPGEGIAAEKLRGAGLKLCSIEPGMSPTEIAAAAHS